MIRVAIAGGRGYVGGELLRLLLKHPGVEIRQVTSGSCAGRFVHTVHPNLRGVTGLRFSEPDALERADVLFLALPHGRAAQEIEALSSAADVIVDTSADFRLTDPADYSRWYDRSHPNEAWLSRFVYGLPERNRALIAQSSHVSGVGCNAAAAILALAPLADAGILTRAVLDLKVGSSEAGARVNAGSHHAERSHAVRSFKPVGHRHQGEIVSQLGSTFDLAFSVTGVGTVRGVLATAHCFLNETLTDRDLWQLFRNHYSGEPFIRLVAGRSGIHRYPEPKILAGTNLCDIGFVADPDSRTNRVVVMAALDNLTKGAAGNAVQCMNLMTGIDERTGLDFPGLHPI